jgi:predicted DsbA family dithiol-disulfide isomerase
VHDLVTSDPDVEVVWRAFELRPDPMPTLDPSGDYLKRAWTNSVYPLAARLGVTMKLPPIQPRSRLAHEAAHWARTQGRFDDLHEEIFRALFERGEDIGNPEVLIALASKRRLDAEALHRALDIREFEASVVADEREAAELGVSGVPAFVAGRRASVSGVQPVDTLKQLVDSVRQPGTL